MRIRLNPDESDTQSEANQGLRLLPGDRLVLCSDGVTDLLRDAEILKILQNSELEDCPEHLVNLANQRGGHDNMTVVILEVPQPADITRPIHIHKTSTHIPINNLPRTTASWVMIILLLVAILMMVSLLIYAFTYW
jgi:hypothetical protein